VTAAIFVGNSFTQRNDVPALVARLAAARGLTLAHRLFAAGGASLRMHWNKGEARAAIESTRPDWVVLQEQSTLPIKNAARFHENVRLFDETIRAAGSRPVLYMTWARLHAPETQRQLTDAYRAIGAELGAAVAPAGVAWERVLATTPHPVLHDKDGSHPTLAGSYLAACTLFATMFGERPEGDDGGLGAADAALLRDSAWEVARG
jgi:hypothetical protein